MCGREAREVIMNESIDRIVAGIDRSNAEKAIGIILDFLLRKDPRPRSIFLTVRRRPPRCGRISTLNNVITDDLREK